MGAGCVGVKPSWIQTEVCGGSMTQSMPFSHCDWRIQPFTKGGAKTGQCRRDTGSPGLHRESSFQKGGPNRNLALLDLNLARLAPLDDGSASAISSFFFSLFGDLLTTSSSGKHFGGRGWTFTIFVCLFVCFGSQMVYSKSFGGGTTQMPPPPRNCPCLLWI